MTNKQLVKENQFQIDNLAVVAILFSVSLSAALKLFEVLR